MKILKIFYLSVFLILISPRNIQAQEGCVHPDIDSNIIHDIPFFGDNI